MTKEDQVRILAQANAELQLVIDAMNRDDILAFDRHMEIYDECIAELGGRYCVTVPTPYLFHTSRSVN
jgi:hypothetical protein